MTMTPVSDDVIRAASFEIERWQRNANMALSDFQRMAEPELVFNLNKLANQLSSDGQPAAALKLLEVVYFHHKACLELIRTIRVESAAELAR